VSARLAADARVALVTGSTSGIGRALAEALAGAGLTVGVVARDAVRGEAVRAAIAAATGNRNVRAFTADLSLQGDVRVLAAEVLDAFPRLDVVVHCAAVFQPRRTVTADGLETMFATNHLAPFLLTTLLGDRLRKSAPARVVTLTAPSTVRLDFDDLQAQRRFGALRQFGATKAANLVFAFELARLLDGSGVVSNAVHPGLARTGLMRRAPALLRWATGLVSAPPERAAAAIAQLAISPDHAARTGRFFKSGREIEPPPYTRDEQVGSRLWGISAVLAGIDEGVIRSRSACRSTRSPGPAGPRPSAPRSPAPCAPPTTSASTRSG
jgi:NAD(P)-dependent dehydrogenase (short-subunit alcohol dehydrogenase family)